MRQDDFNLETYKQARELLRIGNRAVKRHKKKTEKKEFPMYTILTDTFTMNYRMGNSGKRIRQKILNKTLYIFNRGEYEF